MNDGRFYLSDCAKTTCLSRWSLCFCFVSYYRSTILSALSLFSPIQMTVTKIVVKKGYLSPQKLLLGEKGSVLFSQSQAYASWRL